MYYRSVNRGVSFTKPGRYAVGMVLLLGFIATGSGYNALYLSLSMGLAILIISGILSEKVMKHYELEKLSEVTAEAETPFSVEFVASNKSSSFAIYGVENLVLSQVPRFRWLFGNIPYKVNGTLLTLQPGRQENVRGNCTGLPRGHYSQFTVLQRTLYPFGLLAKFKLSTLPADIEILPKSDPAYTALLRQQLRTRLSGLLKDNQFHSHRPFQTRDSLRHVDWKKSAGHDADRWLLKQYESPSNDSGILIEGFLEELATIDDAAKYEAHLSRLRSACEVVHESRRRLLMRVGPFLVVGYPAALSALAAIPTFEKRQSPIQIRKNISLVPGHYLRLTIRPEVERPVWNEQPQWVAA